MSNARRFAKNSLALTTAGVSVALLGAVYRVYIARCLGEVEFGKYVFIITCVAYGTILSLLGLRNVIVREVARAPGRYKAFLRGALKLRLITTTSGFAILCLVILFLNKSGDVKVGMVIYALSLFPLAMVDIMESMFIAAESAIYVTITNVSGNLLKIVIGIYLLTHGFGLLAILWLFLAVSVLNSCVDWLFFRKLFRKVTPVEEPKIEGFGRYMFLQSLPFFYILLASKVYYKNDVMVLSLMKGDRVVGGYGAAYMPVDFLLLTAASIVMAAYPVMSRFFSDRPERLGELQGILSRYLLMIFLPVAVLLTIVGPELVGWVFGKEYTGSASALRILAWIPPAEAVTVAMGMMLGASYKQGLSAKVACFGAGMCLCLNLLLIPRYGYMGAAVGTTTAVYLNMCVAIYAVNRVVAKLPIFDFLVRPVASAGFMLLVAFLVSMLAGKWIAISTAVPAYVLALVLTGSFTREDLRFIRTSVMKRTEEAPS